MRTVSGILVIFGFAATLLQDSFDLRNRYGPPDVERFAIRPDITMAVEYGSDGKACIVEFEPRQAFIHGMNIRGLTFSKETAMELLDEVTPPEIRGKEKIPLFGSGGLQSSCIGLVRGEYENIQVSAGMHMCKTPIAVRSLSVRFKRPACDPLMK
jgi:hypothetical protein